MKLPSILCALLACIVSALGANPAPLQMITSPENIKSWAIEQVASGEINLGSNSLLAGSDNATNVYVSGSGADDVMVKLAAGRFRFRVADPREGVYTWGSLFDASGEQLFYGSGYGSIDSSGASWVLGESKVQFKLSSSIPLPLPFTDELRKAYLVYRDEDGNYQWSDGLYFDEWSNRFFFPTEYAGKEGQLIFELSDGKGGVKSSLVYSLKNGAVLNIPQIVAGVGVGIENYASYDIAKGFTGNVLMYAIGDQWHDAPVIKVKLSAQTPLYLVCRVLQKGSGSTLEIPTSGKYRKEGATQILNWQRPVVGPDLTLPAGTYYIWWDTTSFDKVPMSPWQSEGKG